MISKARFANLVTPDTNINHLKSSNVKLYTAIKNIGDASKQLINAVFPPVSQEGYIERFIIPSSVVANDVLLYRYVVILPTDTTGYWNFESIDLISCYVSCKVQGTTITSSFDIKISQRKGTTVWKSLFKTGFNPFIPPNTTFNNTVQFAINNLFPDDLLRIDILVSDPLIAGLQFTLVGNYVTSEVNIP